VPRSAGMCTMLRHTLLSALATFDLPGQAID
jgi:hypothetical protein